MLWGLFLPFTTINMKIIRKWGQKKIEKKNRRSAWKFIVKKPVCTTCCRPLKPKTG